MSHQTLITISDVSAFHLLGTSTLPLTPAPSALTLLRSDSLLTLQVGTLAFPLSASTTLGTQNGNPRGYFLKPALDAEGDKDQPTGWIKIELPESAVENGLRDQFEGFLLKHGLLLEGAEATADEFGSGLKEASINQSLAITGAKETYFAENPASDKPTEFSNFTHKASSTLASATGSVQGATHYAAEAVLGAAASVGEWMGKKVGGPAAPPKSEGEPTATALATPPAEKSALRKSVEGGLETTSNVATSLGSDVSDSASTMYNATTDSLGARIEHTHGEEAAELSGRAGETAENVGGVAKDILVRTSGIVIGGLGAEGFRKGASSS